MALSSELWLVRRTRISGASVQVTFPRVGGKENLEAKMVPLVVHSGGVAGV